jgi:hypothetical protein
VNAIPDRYRGSDRKELALYLLADVLDPPAPEEAAADPARWRAAVANVQAALASPARMGEPRGWAHPPEYGTRIRGVGVPAQCPWSPYAPGLLRPRPRIHMARGV